jgi:signal transduction histidine kinase/DNA-binding NarL/FixJ family response regulator
VKTSSPVSEDPRQRQIEAAETRLLYDNAWTGIVATFLIAALLAYAQWDVRPPSVVAAWLLCVLLVSGGRYALVQRYRRAPAREIDSRYWCRAFTAGAALAAAGWVAAAVLLYAPDRPMNEAFLVFVIGGVMLGGASLLAARPEAFLTFLLPTGLFTALRLALQGDQSHLVMGFLAAVFTLATVAATWRFHQVIESSFKLRFDNHDLIDSLQNAKHQAESLNRELEQRVQDRTARLTEADQRKDEFLATLAHELRNPLAPIRFALDILKPDAPPAAAARARDVIDRQVRQLVRLVDDLLDVSRITANKIQLRREPHDLGRLMEIAVESILPLASAAEHTVDISLPPSPIHVNGDSTRLVQIFANVLNNAVKFTPRGGRISLAGYDRGGEAVVRIRDTGIGIGPDLLPRVFDMFRQGEPGSERSSCGLGIGLTLARRLVEMHDGQIEIRSAGAGQGTDVRIHLPIVVATAATAVAAPAGNEPPAQVREGLRVLIVEDNLDAAEMLEMTMSLLGHLTRVAHDGGTAVSVATEFAPDVIFLDIGLPVMNGYEVARALRGRPEFDDVYIAAVTGWGQDEDRRQARDAGCDSHFTKPLSPDVLRDLLGAIAQRKYSGQALTGAPRTRRADCGAAHEPPGSGSPSSL